MHEGEGSRGGERRPRKAPVHVGRGRRSENGDPVALGDGVRRADPRSCPRSDPSSLHGEESCGRSSTAAGRPPSRPEASAAESRGLREPGRPSAPPAARPRPPPGPAPARPPSAPHSPKGVTLISGMLPGALPGPVASALTEPAEPLRPGHNHRPGTPAAPNPARGDVPRRRSPNGVRFRCARRKRRPARRSSGLGSWQPIPGVREADGGGATGPGRRLRQRRRRLR